MMMADREKIILVLVFVCGLLAGYVLFGVIATKPVPLVKQVVFTEKAPKPLGPYSQAVQSGDLMFLSGQIGIDPVTGNVTGTAGEQTTRTMENLREVLAASGLGFGHVLQTRIYLTNMSDWTAVNGIYGSYFNDTYPSRVTIGVAELPKGAKVEIEMIAKKPQE